MRTCRKCGVAFAGIRCLPCKRATQAAYYTANAAEINARRYAAYAADPVIQAVARKRTADWIAADPERARASWKASHPNHREYTSKYYEKNKEKLTLSSREWRENNPERLAIRKAKWRKANADKCAASCANREAAKLNATPVWASESVISEMYSIAAARVKETGIEWHVDHIVPLRSPLVCGLHCETNLRVVTAKENETKGNRHWPDMP